DVITHNGYLMAISRHGINRIETGPLSKATFEEMADMLIEAAVNAKSDDLNGISARIILGLKGKCGTGSFDLYYPTLDKKETSEKSLNVESLRKYLIDFKKKRKDEEEQNDTIRYKNRKRERDLYSPYLPSSSAYSPSSPTYQSSPTHPPSSPTYTPSSPTYTPSSPAYSPSSPAYSP